MHIRLTISLIAAVTLALACQAQTASRPAATMQPDISIIGDVRGSTGTRTGDDDQIQLNEIELVAGSRFYPGMRADLVVAFHGPEFSAEVEEAYASIDQITNRAPIGARLGIVRLPFGKVNPKHPHQWAYADQPLATRNLLGEEFTGNGFELIGTPRLGGGNFLQAQVSRWTPRAHDHDHEAGGAHQHELGAGLAETFTMGRLWGGGRPGKNAELELGVSTALGTGAHEEDDGAGGVVVHHPDVKLYGADVTWRRWMSRERRLLVQGEVIRRDEKHDDGELHRRDGYYLLGSMRPDRWNELGVRYDWSEAPGHTGHERALSLIGTRYMNEMTFTRLQLTQGRDLHGKSYHEVTLQFVFGFGPHAHVLQ